MPPGGGSTHSGGALRCHPVIVRRSPTGKSIQLIVEDDADQVIRDVGLRVAELRQRLGVSQRTFAAKVGLTSGNYSQIESGKQNLTLRTMVRIAKGLGVTVTDLLQPPGTP